MISEASSNYIPLKVYFQYCTIVMVTCLCSVTDNEILSVMSLCITRRARHRQLPVSVDGDDDDVNSAHN